VASLSSTYVNACALGGVDEGLARLVEALALRGEPLPDLVVELLHEVRRCGRLVGLGLQPGKPAAR